jgi:16S rRNA (uracil1498-N3)-methyltransferase
LTFQSKLTIGRIAGNRKVWCFCSDTWLPGVGAVTLARQLFVLRRPKWHSTNGGIVNLGRNTGAKGFERMAVHDFRSQRLYVDCALAVDVRHACDKQQANYLRNVLRLGGGEELLVFNGRDGEWRAVVQVRGKRDCDLVAIEQMRMQTSGPDVDYLFAPLKRGRLDYMVQKATEMGVATMQPVFTRRTIADRVNVERMRANVIEAAEQCGVLRVPEVRVPQKLETVLADWPAGRTLLFADEGADVSDPVAAFRDLERGAPIAVIIGPEGGFADHERELIKAVAQCRTISLGPRIMRADTAAVALLALVNAMVGDWVA